MGLARQPQQGARIGEGARGVGFQRRGQQRFGFLAAHRGQMRLATRGAVNGNGRPTNETTRNGAVDVIWSTTIGTPSISSVRSTVSFVGNSGPGERAEAAT